MSDYRGLYCATKNPKSGKSENSIQLSGFMRLSFKTRIEKKSGLSRARRLANRLSISAQVTKIIVYCLIKKKREILSDQSDSSLDQRTNREKVAGK